MELQSNLAFIVEALPDMVFEMSADGVYLFVHAPEGQPYSPDTHGPPGGLVGKSIYDVIPQHGADLAIESISKALATGKLVESQWSRPFPDGEVRHYNSRTVPTDRNTCVVLIRDETDRVNAIESLKRSNEDLQQFAYVASHDLQEPIRGMFVSAQVMLEDLSDSLGEEHRIWLERIKDNAIRLQRMVRDLLQFSRAGASTALSPVDFDASAEVRSVLEDFRATIEETHAEVSVADLPWVRYDRTMFRVVLANLLSNALKFVRKGDAPRVRISPVPNDSLGQCTLSVRDNGIGIPKDKQRVIFEPGRRLHHRAVYSGSGLGLASVARAISRCGGELGLRSSDEGTEFLFTLPLGSHG